jgi:hypothetical protein
MFILKFSFLRNVRIEKQLFNFNVLQDAADRRTFDDISFNLTSYFIKANIQNIKNYRNFSKAVKRIFVLKMDDDWHFLKL